MIAKNPDLHKCDTTTSSMVALAAVEASKLVSIEQIKNL
jgi:hypothetical protein